MHEEKQPMPLSKSQQSLLVQQQYINLSNLKKEDKQKETDITELEKILDLETDNHAIRDRIRSVWLNEVYPILKSKAISCKLSYISSRMSRIVIQVFFVVIHTGSNIDRVYNIIIDILKFKGLLDSNNFIAPYMIMKSETEKIPHIDIIRIMDLIMDEIVHTDGLLRENWGILSSLRIDISEILNKDKLSPEIKIKVSEIYSTKTKVRGGITIDKLAPLLHNLLKGKYTLEQIKKMMKYKN
jgi:hypothetical protein